MPSLALPGTIEHSCASGRCRSLAALVVMIWATLGTASLVQGQPTELTEPKSATANVAFPHLIRHRLAMGPNGPIPAIVVDQFGYHTSARKIAVIRSPQIGYDSTSKFAPGNSIALVDVTSGEAIKVGAPVPWNAGGTDAASGDRAWWFDFSEIKRPGRYVVVDIENRIRSPEFGIADTVYRTVLKRAIKTFFYQRAGAIKPAEFAGAAWADAASHLRPGQDPYSRPWPGARSIFGASAAPVRDLRGGWYDAGDYNKYTTWAARNMLVLLEAYHENPRAFDDDVGIPESNNGIPDILDEVKWSLDWLVRMQGPDGSVLCVHGLASGTPPSVAAGPSQYGPPTTSATLMAAAAFAYASKVYGALGNAEFKDYAADLAKRARAAWTWAVANPSVFYWNNDEPRQPGSKGLAHGQQELGEKERALAWFEAAVNLYEVSGDPQFLEYASSHHAALLPRYGPTLWEVDAQNAVLRFSNVKGLSATLVREIQATFLDRIAPQAARHASDVERTDPYRAPLKDYTWGSNKAKAMQARLFHLVAALARNEDIRRAAREAALDYVHYIHGVNPLGLVYLTNMGAEGATHSANTMFHAWFAKGTKWEKTAIGRPGPPPGFLVGGPNPSFRLDSCCSGPRSSGLFLCWSPSASALCERNFRPPMGQPPAKSYLQFNDSWPANSWEVTEPSTSYQAYYVRMLASAVH